MSRIPRLLPFLVALALAAPLIAEERPPRDDETVDEYLHYLIYRGRCELACAAVDETVAAAVRAKTTTAAPAGSFASDLQASIEDFLPLFQGLVKGVDTDDDGTSLTARLAALDLGDYGRVAIQATATEPAVYEPLAEAIAESVRPVETESLLDGVSDFDDLTLRASYGLTRPAAGLARTRFMLGRDYDLYRELVDEILAASWDVVDGGLEDAVQRSTIPLTHLFDEIFDERGVSISQSLTFEQIRQLDRGADLAADLIAGLQEIAEHEQAYGGSLAGLRLDALPALIDNQPQLVFSYSQRLPDEVVGPDEWTFGLHYEHGRRNFNRLLGRRDGGETATTALSDLARDPSVSAEAKWIVDFSYTDRSAYRRSHEYTTTAVGADGETVEVPQLAEVDLPGSEDLRGKLSYTRFVGAPMVERSATSPALAATLPEVLAESLPKLESRPRLTFSLEGRWVDDPRRQDRVVGSLSYDVPLSASLVLPLTITYANRSEFLGEQDDVLGAHIGLSYKLQPLEE